MGRIEQSVVVILDVCWGGGHVDHIPHQWRSLWYPVPFAVLQGYSTTISHSRVWDPLLSFIRTQFSLHLPGVLLQQIPGWSVCFSHTLYPVYGPRVLPFPHFHLNFYTECFFGGRGSAWQKLESSGKRELESRNHLQSDWPVGKSTCHFLGWWLILVGVALGGWVTPSLGRWTWAGCKRTSKLAVSPWSLPLLLLVLLPWLPSVMVGDGVMSAK